MIIVTKCLPHEVHSLLHEHVPASVQHRKWTTLILLDGDRFPVFIVSATDENFGARMVFYTGPTEFKKCLCSEARVQGYKLTSHGLWLQKGKELLLLAGRTEESIFAILGLPYKHPKKRHHFLTEARRELNGKRREERRQTEVIRTSTGYFIPTTAREVIGHKARNSIQVAKGTLRRRPRYKSQMVVQSWADRKSRGGLVPCPDETEPAIVLGTRSKPNRRKVRKVRKKKVERTKKPYDAIRAWRKRWSAKEIKEVKDIDNSNVSTGD